MFDRNTQVMSLNSHELIQHVKALHIGLEPKGVNDLEEFLLTSSYIGENVPTKVYHILSMFTYGITTTDFDELMREPLTGPIESLFSIPINYRLVTSKYSLGKKLPITPFNRYLYSESETLELFECDLIAEMRSFVGDDYESYQHLHGAMAKFVDRILAILCPSDMREDSDYEEYNGIMSLMTYHTKESILIFREVEGSIHDYI